MDNLLCFIESNISVYTLLSIDDALQSELGGCWLHAGVSPAPREVLQLEDESYSGLESGRMLSPNISQLKMLFIYFCK